MPVYEYRDYELDKDLVERVVARVERVSDMLSGVVDELGTISARAVGGDGDVVLSVNADGQLTSLSLAQGCATRYTPTALTELINTTIDEAVTIANTQAASLAGKR
jgi:hypothetical protein